MNGDIQLVSTLGVGSTFIVELPLIKSSASNEEQRKLTPFYGKRAILADKHQLSRLSTQHLLESLGIEVIEQDFPVKCDPSSDLLLIGFGHDDIQSGFAEREICRLRSSCWLPFIILMSATEKTIIDQYQTLSGDWYTSKPLTSQVLKGLLSEIYSTRASLTSSTPATSHGDDLQRVLNEKRILVVDDNEINLKLISTLMRDRGARVTEASDGQEAVSLSMNHEFDLIIMDIHMPGLKGTEAAIKIRERESEENRHTPIIALTADAVPTTRTQIHEAKMDAYLLKPIDEQQIWVTIVSVLSKSPSQPAKHYPNWSKHPSLNNISLPVRDLEKALSITGGDRRLADEMLAQLKRELPEHFNSIKSAYQARDWDSLRETTHKLHGSTSSCGVSALDYAVQQLDNSCRDQSVDKAQVDAIETEINRLLKS